MSSLPLKSVSGSDKSRLDYDGNQQRSYSKRSKWWPLALTHAYAAGYTPLINGFVDHALWNRRRNGNTSFYATVR